MNAQPTKAEYYTADEDTIFDWDVLNRPASVVLSEIQARRDAIDPSGELARQQWHETPELAVLSEVLRMDGPAAFGDRDFRAVAGSIRVRVDDDGQDLFNFDVDMGAGTEATIENVASLWDWFDDQWVERDDV